MLSQSHSSWRNCERSLQLSFLSLQDSCVITSFVEMRNALKEPQVVPPNNQHHITSTTQTSSNVYLQSHRPLPIDKRKKSLKANSVSSHNTHRSAAYLATGTAETMSVQSLEGE
eukprot:TRINITY_DN64008_c0_g2_i1.p2 TRINITY_DN64008_c0_g2~~TRINITY_DN64008_c0_g2_i1.p2  ORF type:complete len:114 (-),score=2.04 TRINITY_DN64008_c0_g2_i1:180-521(-)